MAATKTFGDIGVDYGDDNYSYIGGLMSDRWWVNDDADNAWENANNWSTAEGGAGGAGIPTATDNVLFSDTSSGADCNMSANSIGINLYTASVDTGGTDDYTGIIDLSTFNLVLSGETKLASGCTLKIGISADTGLTTNGIIFIAGSLRDWQTTSKINCSGNWIEPASNISTNSFRGSVVITENINLTKPNFNNYFYDFKINVTKIVTLLSTGHITSSSSNDTVINGVLAAGINGIVLGASATGSITVGVNGDFTGSSSFFFNINSLATLTNNRVTAFSHTGGLRTSGSSIIDLCIPAWNFENANVAIYGSTIQAVNRCVKGAAILKCIDFVIRNTANFDIAFTSNGNPSYEFSGDVNFNTGGGTFVTVWTKGTGILNLIGNDSTFSVDDQILEDIVVNKNIGQSVELKDDYRTAKITMQGGKIIADSLVVPHTIKMV